MFKLVFLPLFNLLLFVELIYAQEARICDGAAVHAGNKVVVLRFGNTTTTAVGTIGTTPGARINKYFFINKENSPYIETFSFTSKKYILYSVGINAQISTAINVPSPHGSWLANAEGSIAIGIDDKHSYIMHKSGGMLSRIKLGLSDAAENQRIELPNHLVLASYKSDTAKRSIRVFTIGYNIDDNAPTLLCTGIGESVATAELCKMHYHRFAMPVVSEYRKKLLFLNQDNILDDAYLVDYSTEKHLAMRMPSQKINFNLKWNDYVYKCFLGASDNTLVLEDNITNKHFFVLGEKSIDYSSSQFASKSRYEIQFVANENRIVVSDKYGTLYDYNKKDNTFSKILFDKNVKQITIK